MRAKDRAQINDAPALGAKRLIAAHDGNRPEHDEVVVSVEALPRNRRERAEAEEPQRC